MFDKAARVSLMGSGAWSRLGVCRCFVSEALQDSGARRVSPRREVRRRLGGGGGVFSLSLYHPHLKSGMKSDKC